ncbi:MAG: V-type ATP synthase subunit F [Oscillospiraceae bacterium]|jgi:V/A-type H+-transporting ATPase subunit F|nr:V-type ATP synthase subunit F [Oscillospiraceae bacterium]
MKIYLISDNVDTLVGMRLAGIDGIVVHDENELKKALKNAVCVRDVAIVLITEQLVKMCQKFICDFKLKYKKPLIVEIPDRHSEEHTRDSITQHIENAIGIKM